MNPDCPVCGGTGWLIRRDPEKGELAQRCACLQEDTLHRRAEKAGIPPRFLHVDLKSYMPQKEHESQQQVFTAIERFVRDYPAVPDNKGLLLLGSVGLGKTRLLCGIGNALLKKSNQLSLAYIDWNDLIREMGSGESAQNRSFSDINTLVQRLVGVDVLLFDELGASRVSPWVHDYIYYIINKRYNHQKMILGASNFLDRPGERLTETLSQRLGERIRSRLYEMTQAMELTGVDYRRQYG